MKKILLFLLTLAMPAFASAQVADTVFVSVFGDLNSVTFTTFEVNLNIGDTVQYVAQAFDSEGDPVAATYRYASSDTTVVKIDAYTGVAVGLKKGTNIAITVMAEAGSLFMASFRPPDSLNWTGYDTISCSEPDCSDAPTLQYCAYLVNDAGFLVGESPGPPTCPIVWPWAPNTTDPVFASIPRPRLGFLELLAMSEGVGQGPLKR